MVISIIALACLMIGGLVGVLIMAMMNAASDADDEAERIWAAMERGRKR